MTNSYHYKPIGKSFTSMLKINGNVIYKLDVENGVPNRIYINKYFSANFKGWNVYQDNWLNALSGQELLHERMRLQLRKKRHENSISEIDSEIFQLEQKLKAKGYLK